MAKLCTYIYIYIYIYTYIYDTDIEDPTDYMRLSVKSIPWEGVIRSHHIYMDLVAFFVREILLLTLEWEEVNSNDRSVVSLLNTVHRTKWEWMGIE